MLRAEAASQEAESEISLEDLQKHNSASSLWVAINGTVYDVTTFAQVHPGGPDILYQHAGQDVSQLFAGIHPAGTIERNIRDLCVVGVLQPQAPSRSDEETRIAEARRSICSVDDIIELGDFELLARPVCPSKAWNYYVTGAETESAMIGNSSAYDKVVFRPRVFRDTTTVDYSANILGVYCAVPFYVAPTARNGLAQPLGEIAVTRGAGATGMLQVLSHVASRGLDEVMDERRDGQQVAWQLYMKLDRQLAEAEIRRAVSLGAQSIWLTVDTTVLPKHTRERKAAVQARTSGAELTGRTPRGLLSSRHDPNLSWDDIRWIKSLAPGTPLVIKGIGAWEDAVLARQHGADAIVLSNHGGRALDYANAPLRTLRDINEKAPDVIKDPNFQVFVDGGVRRGTDILKALCLGANAVGLGRPFIYAAAGWGQKGMEKAVDILKEELEIAMRQLGVSNIAQLGPQYLDTSGL